MYKCAIEMESIGSLGMPLKLVLTLVVINPILVSLILFSEHYFGLHSIQQLFSTLTFLAIFFVLIGIFVHYKGELELKMTGRPKNHYIGDSISFGLIVIAMYQMPLLLRQLDKPGHNKT
jgi:signal transduction histidine kinase